VKKISNEIPFQVKELLNPPVYLGSVGLNPENGAPMFYDENGTITSDINFQSTSTDYLKYEENI